MASNLTPLLFTGTEKVVITRWRVHEDFMINQSPFVLFHYRTCDSTGVAQGTELRYKVNQSGITVRRMYRDVGDHLEPDDVLLDYEPCSHSTLMKDLCALCGVNINNFDSSEKRKIAESTSVSMVHSIPELRVSKQVAEDLGRADEDRLLKSRKLVLLVDLDQTIIHSTNQVVPHDAPNIHHYQLYGPNSPWYHTKFRPYMTEFLEEISKYFELHICTFGARRYAHQISNLIDPKCKYFPKDRILSRDEFFDPRSKTGNMKSLFPCGDSMVCIIDDRVDVWNYSPNVVHVKPYLCFKTDDINAPEKLNIGFKNFNTSEKTGDTTKEFTSGDDCETSENEKEEESKDSQEVGVDGDAQVKEPKSTDDADAGMDKEANSPPENSGSSSNSSEKAENMECDGKTEGSVAFSDGKSTSIGQENLLEDNDDYLLYLKDILIRIHREFYSEYEEKRRYQSEGEEILIPDLKEVIPRVRKLVLHGVNIVFSGVIATNTPAELSRFYRLAQSLGAIITNDIIVNGSPKTTHLVAAKWGTIKVNKCLKYPNIKLVTPDWLIVCAERWEKVDEAMFRLNKDTVYNVSEREDCKVFIPYGHLRSKSSKQPSPSTSSAAAAAAAATTDSDEELPESETMLDFSPLSSFSITDLSEMGKEVDDACSEGDNLDSSDDSDDESDLDEEEEGEAQRKSRKEKKKVDIEEDDDCMNYENEGEYPLGWKNFAGKRRGIKRSKDDDDEEEEGDSELDDRVSTSSDAGDDDSNGSLDEEAAALERQFQSAD